MKKILLILIMSSFLVANFVQAAAVKVRPTEIKIEANPGVLIKEEMIIENPGDNVALFEVFVDNFSDWIKVKPESFTLESKELQKVVLEIKNKERGVFLTTISVVAKPLSQMEFKANAGVKIPLEIKISEEKPEFWLASISRIFLRFSKNQQNLIYLLVIIIILFSLGIWLKRKKKIMKEKDYYDSPNFKK